MSRKYRVLIVEDEEIERKALVIMLKYSRRDIEEIRTAANGVQALEHYKSFAPDIVFMDINIPGINGMDVIRQMRYLSGNSAVVIVSAHSQFAYAREALRLGVYDFLVKPIHLEDINRLLDELTAQIEKKHSREESLKYQQKKMEAIRPILERDCIQSIASLRSDTPLSSLFDFMRIPIICGFVFVLHGEGIGGSISREIKESMSNMGMKCIGEMINEFCIFVALGDRNISSAQIKETMTVLSNRLKFEENDYQIGVGYPANCADDLRRSYEQAMTAVHSTAVGSGTLFFHSEMKIFSRISLPEITEVAAKIIRCIRDGDYTEMDVEIRRFFNPLLTIDGCRSIQEAAYWLYVTVIGNFSEYASEVKPLTAAQIFAAQNGEALCRTLTDGFKILFDLQNENLGQRSNQIVAKAKQIVKSRFSENLTLDSVAEELNISLFYLGKLFRKHTGISFTEYLTNARLERAKQMLENESLSVKEVAYAAGFNSQSYFSKVFKKHTGKSPSEFRGE